jgi:N-acetyl-anhydromuramyl-L-alanine amidase AmpD
LQILRYYRKEEAPRCAQGVVRSSDGQITQTVREKDVAWHAGNWSYNTESILIEHEGYVSDCTRFTYAMYRARVALSRHIADKYGIPKDPGDSESWLSASGAVAPGPSSPMYSRL